MHWIYSSKRCYVEGYFFNKVCAYFHESSIPFSAIHSSQAYHINLPMLWMYRMMCIVLWYKVNGKVLFICLKLIYSIQRQYTSTITFLPTNSCCWCFASIWFPCKEICVCWKLRSARTKFLFAHCIIKRSSIIQWKWVEVQKAPANWWSTHKIVVFSRL